MKEKQQNPTVGERGEGEAHGDSMVVELRKRNAWAVGGERPCAFINSMHDARKFQCSKSTLLGLTRQSKLSSTNIRTREETFSCAISYILYEKYFTFYLFIQNTPLIKILTTIPSSNSTQTRVGKQLSTSISYKLYCTLD